MPDMPDKAIQLRNERVLLLQRLGYEWSNQADVFYDVSMRMAPLNSEQAHELAKRIQELGVK